VENGYQHHSPVPSEPAEISTERIDEEMESWLMEWRDATKAL
jgi:hypothetical protein